LNYKKQKHTVPIMQEFSILLSGDSSAFSVEIFSHYDAFYFWIRQDIACHRDLKILDLGGKNNEWLAKCFE